MNLLSAVCDAATIALMTWTVARLTRSLTAALASGLALAFSAPFWSTRSWPIDRNRSAAHPDADLLRAGGLVHAVHPAVVDHARAREDLMRYVAPGRSGSQAEEASRALEYLDRLPR